MTSSASKSLLNRRVSVAVAWGCGSMRNWAGSAWVAPVAVSICSMVSEPPPELRGWFICSTTPG